ncbi:MAG: hypothetical protein NZM37_05390 [Sandaracinaceae bacterium]|nr:hypothetical protein [Sandaracinaceae bacterium]MDW8246105.1 hypothetical protein [Sandaracinaceae bacterium]
MAIDSTLVTGSPAALKPPQPGQVIGERYEIINRIDSDALVLTYHAIDQELEKKVIVRCTAPGLLSEKDAQRIKERLSPFKGSKGAPSGRSLWLGVLDVEAEGALVLFVEPMPKGSSLRALFDHRRMRHEPIHPRELLNWFGRAAHAIDRMHALVAASGLYHGDLRPTRVYVSQDAVELSSPFLLASLPGDAVAEVIARDGMLRHAFAPEVAEGLGGPASDRYGIAALIWEALTGLSPRQPLPSSVDLPAPLGHILRRYLNPDPSARPPTLQPLIEGLAHFAGCPVPAWEDHLLLPQGTPIGDESADHANTIRISTQDVIEKEEDTVRAPLPFEVQPPPRVQQPDPPHANPSPLPQPPPLSRPAPPPISPTISRSPPSSQPIEVKKPPSSKDQSTLILSPPSRPLPHRLPTNDSSEVKGWLLVIASVVVAALILGAAIWYRSSRLGRAPMQSEVSPHAWQLAFLGA